MKKWIIYWLLLGLWWQSNAQEICKDGAWIADMEASQRGWQLQYRENPFMTNYDLRYHRLEWEVDPAVRYISGTVTSWFVPLEDNFQEMSFELAANMQVNAITYGGAPLEYVHHSDGRLQIFFPNSLPMGQLDSLAVAYEGEPATIGFGSFSVNGQRHSRSVDAFSEPYGAQKNGTLQTEPQRQNRCQDVCATPNPYRVASNGLLVGTHEADGATTYHWQHRYPIPAYLIAIGVTDYAVFSDFITFSRWARNGNPQLRLS
ncbi:MAG: hypothetical protein R2795_20090 [Saprospiraceae bacterium]